MDGSNYIAQLNELAQKIRQSVNYEEISVNGPPHNRTFTMRAVLNKEPYPEAVGQNKKEAKQNAAKNALEKLGSIQINNSITSRTESPSPSSAVGGVKQANYTSWLNEYGQKQRMNITPKESVKLGPASATYWCRFVIDDKEFPEAFGSTKKEAKEEAARLVYLELHEESHPVAGDVDKGTVSDMDELSKSIIEMSPNSNYIGMLNQYCQKLKIILDFKRVHMSGPAHMPEFVYKISMNGKEYPEGRGKSAREAKQYAAQLAWQALQESSNWESQEAYKSSATKDKDSSTSSSECDSKGKRSTSDSVVFKNSNSADSPKMETKPRGAKAQRKLAPNFNSPTLKKQESNNVKQSPEKSATQQRFLVDYDHIQHIGRGGFGYVLKARRKLENRFFAVKIVGSTNKSLREVSALVRLEHPNIVRYYSCWIEDTSYSFLSSDSSLTSSSDASGDFLYIQMELCEMDNLRARIADWNLNGKSHRRKKALKIVKQLVKGVEYIHSKSLIHRDLKPANILFGNDGNVKIGDFGLVTCAENDGDESLLKRTAKRGTRSYMSPEQSNGLMFDNKVDIFALGLINFELLWHITTDMEKSKVFEGVKERRFPEGFCEKYNIEHNLIKRMLSEHPTERPDATEVHKSLNTMETLLLKDKTERKENRTV